MAERKTRAPRSVAQTTGYRSGKVGWIRGGVATADAWPTSNEDLSYLQAKIPNKKLTVAEEALQTPGGAFYRVCHREARYMHAVLGELGVLFCTLMVHSGWQKPSGALPKVKPAQRGTLSLPVRK